MKNIIKKSRHAKKSKKHSLRLSTSEEKARLQQNAIDMAPKAQDEE